MFIQAYLQTAEQVIKSYKGDEPLHSSLKKFFAQHKKFGSRDRKQIAHLCYCFYRLGKALPELPVKEKFLIGLFLCSTETNAVLKTEAPSWNERVGADIAIKLKEVKNRYPFQEKNIFSFEEHVSAAINFNALSQSILQQPPAHIRIRPGKKETVLKKLSNAGISYEPIGAQCVAVPPATKLDAVLKLNEEAVIQDFSSQQVLNPLLNYLQSHKTPLTSWDCCAASGGKSILLKDYLPKIQLTVSDVRESILVNLRKRFEQAGIRMYDWFVADVGAKGFAPTQKFDLVLCDVPCSGSGTWSRTPEQLYFFKKEKILEYAALQKKIVANASKALQSDSLLLYITCSVFKEENEEAVRFMQEQLSLELVTMQYFEGYHKKADTLFAALLKLQ